MGTALPRALYVRSWEITLTVCRHPVEVSLRLDHAPLEEYPDDKYLPSFLLRGEVPEFVFHALVATDIEGDNIRVVTMHIPDPGQWAKEGRSRRISK